MLVENCNILPTRMVQEKIFFKKILVKNKSITRQRDGYEQLPYHQRNNYGWQYMVIS